MSDFVKLSFDEPQAMKYLNLDSIICFGEAESGKTKIISAYREEIILNISCEDFARLIEQRNNHNDQCFSSESPVSINGGSSLNS